MSLSWHPKEQKRREKKKTAHEEENTVTLSIEIFEATATDHPEHLQTSQQIEQRRSPSV